MACSRGVKCHFWVNYPFNVPRKACGNVLDSVSPLTFSSTPCEEFRSLLGKKKKTDKKSRKWENCGSNRGANDVARVAAKQQSSLFKKKKKKSCYETAGCWVQIYCSCTPAPLSRLVLFYHLKKTQHICFHRGLSQISMNCLTLMRKCLSSLGDETKKDKSAFASLNWLLGSDSLSGKMVHDCVFLFCLNPLFSFIRFPFCFLLVFDCVWKAPGLGRVVKGTGHSSQTFSHLFLLIKGECNHHSGQMVISTLWGVPSCC